MQDSNMNIYDMVYLRGAVKDIIKAFDPDPDRPGLKDTPKRYLKFLYEFTKAQDFELTEFEEKAYNQMVTVKDIPFFSLCEHHMAPFFGLAAIGYIPNDKGRICGISKLPRTLYKFSHRLQNQERITTDVANYIMDKLSPKGVIVCIYEARHLCMEMRGVKTHNAKTITTALKGIFETDPSAKSEFFQTLKL